MRPRSIFRRATARLFLPAALVLVASCDGTRVTTPRRNIADIISSVKTADGTVSAAYVPGTLPADNGGPTIRAQSPFTVITGGSALASVTGSAVYQQILVGVDSAEGYWALTLPSSQIGTELAVTFGQTLSDTNVIVRYALVASGNTGLSRGKLTHILGVGTGDVQVSVAWDSLTDVDLHVISPDGEELYYGNRTATESSGRLDLDSNPACQIDKINNENVTWPVGEAPHGTYVVRLDYYANCSKPQTRYIVTVKLKGQQATSYTGTFTGGGDAGGAGSGITIATFTY